MSWFNRKPAKRTIQIVRTTDFRLEEWTVDPSLVRQAHEALSTPIVQAMLAVLRNESPINYGIPAGATHEDRIAHACKAEGYALAINNLEAMARLVRKPEFIESTFEPEKPTEPPRPTEQQPPPSLL